jgi:nicotinate-nucleotide pyrophosphorylase (carboxylating)
MNQNRDQQTPAAPLPEFFLIDPVIRAALNEDIGQGDVTTLAVVDATTKNSGRLLAKEAGRICGLPVFSRVFTLLDPAVIIKPLVAEGEDVLENTVIATVQGPARSLLTGERVALNFLQRLSGIATRTAHAASQVAGSGVKIVDTRKTTPGLRLLEKYAVRIGGGYNHRFNLADGILIKDNHIRAAGSIALAIRLARAVAPHTLKIEVEVETLEQIGEALEAGADIIMLDNMDLTGIRAAVQQIAGRALVEISGNMGDVDLAPFAAAGIDLISIGALTHSARALDISLRFDSNPSI